MSDPKKYRDRKFCALLYPEDPTHTAAIEKMKSGGYNFAAILHDRDVYEDGDNKGETKKAHWHVVMRFKNAVWNTAVAKELGIEPNYLQECRNVDSALCYLIHYGNDEKFQYEYESVFGPLKLRLASLLTDTDEGTRAMNIVEIIEATPGFIGYTELLKKAVAAGLYSDLRRMGHFATGLIREHNERIAAELNGQETPAQTANRRFGDFLDRSNEVDFVTRCRAADRYGLHPKPLEDND